MTGTDVAASQEPDSRPIVVITAPRAGTALLREVLERHSTVVCPPPADVGRLLALISNEFGAVLTEQVAMQQTVVDKLCRQIVDTTYGACAFREGGSRWVATSLPLVQRTELFRRLYPDAQFVFLVRECRDVVSSLLDATPFGYQQFGLEHYVRNNVGNLVQACAHAWYDALSEILELERRYPDDCYQVRYEDLVLEPAKSLQNLYRFLDLQDERGIGSADDLPTEAGDSHPIGARHVGRGLTLPVDLISEGLRQRIDEVQSVLGYGALSELRTLADSRRATAASVMQASKGGLFQVATESQPLHRATTTHERATFGTFEELLRDRVSSRLRESRVGAKLIDTIGVLLTQTGDRWVIDLERGDFRTTGDPECIVVATADVLLAIAHGLREPSAALRRSEVRVVWPHPSQLESGAPRGTLDDAVAFEVLAELIVPQRVGEGTAVGIDAASSAHG
jgi:hypothetical protein